MYRGGWYLSAPGTVMASLTPNATGSASATRTACRSAPRTDERGGTARRGAVEELQTIPNVAITPAQCPDQCFSPLLVRG